MKLTLKRIAKKETYTIGRIYVDGKYQCDCVEDKDRHLDQKMSLKKIQEVKVAAKTAIPTGTYTVRMDIISPKYSLKPWYVTHCHGARVPRLENVPGWSGVLIHCLTPDTEILTENGWQNLEQYKNNPAQNCYSYNTETGRIELTPVNFFIENQYEGLLYNNEGKRINYSVTDKHHMFAGFKKRDGSYIWEFREADSIPHNAVKFKVAAMRNGESVLPHQKTFYRLLMATVADGYILNWSAESSQVRFHFTKDRKIARLKELVEELGGSYKCLVDHVGKTHITIDPYTSEMITEILNPQRLIQRDKLLPWELLQLNGEDLRDLVLEYIFWDGRYENYLKNNKNMIISSASMHNLEVLQAMATLGGLRSYIRDDTGGGASEKSSKCYALVLYQDQDVIMPEPYTYTTSEYNGMVWCLNNDNHTLIIRRGNHPMIIGNCGNTADNSAGCLIVGKNTVVGMVTDSKATFLKLYNLMYEAYKKGEGITIKIE